MNVLDPFLPDTSAPPTEHALLWQTLLTHSVNGIVGLQAVRDADGNVVDLRYRFISQVALRDTFRQQPEHIHDVTGRLITDYFPSIRQTSLWAAYVAVLTSRQPRFMLERYSLDGYDVWLNQSAAPFGDDCLLLTYTETSHAHQAEQQLALLRNVLDQSPNAIVVFETCCTPDGQPDDYRIVLLNQHFATFAGQLHHQLMGQRLSDLYPLSAAQQQRLHQLMTTGEPLLSQYHAPGIDMWFNVVITRVDNGFMAMLQDVTAHQHAHQREAVQGRLFNEVLNTVQNGLVVFEAVRDADGALQDFRYVVVSQTVLDDLNLPREHVVGNTLLSLLPGLRQSELWNVYERVLATGVPEQVQTHYQHDGYDSHVDVSLSKLNDGLVSSYKRIDEVRRAQQRLEATVQELRQSNESLEQFAYVASHDLQEPLRKIQSFGDVLQQQFTHELSAPAADIIRRMQQSAGRMRILVQDLLTYSRVTGRPDCYQAINTNQLVGDVVADLSEVMHERSAQIDIGELPAVWGDAVLLRQLFQNLFSNALKFTRPGVPARVIVRGHYVTDPIDPDAPGVGLPGTYAQIDVVDNGIGFEEKYAARIFSIFQRLHGRGHYAGTGIGLAICKKVIDMHGGAITARSQPGQGATFTVLLPAP